MRKLTCLSHFTPPTNPLTQCDSHTAVILEAQHKAESRTRLQKGKMAFGTEVNMTLSTAIMEVAIPEPVSSQPTPY